MNRRLAFAAAAALAIALAACGGGGGGGGAVPVTQPPVSSNSNVPPQLLVQNYGQSAMSGATYVGPVTNAHMSVSVLVHQQNAQGLLAYAQAVQNPGSSSFRHFLTPDQIAAQFGASQTDYQNTAQYFVNNGLAVAGWKQRMLLSVSGPQANVEKAFGTTFGIYQRNGQQFIAPNSQPHFLQQLAVDAVGGIVKYRADHTYIIMPPKAGSGLTVGFSPSTVRAAFDYVGAYSAGYDGAGINLGIIGTGPINTTTSGHGDVDLNAYLAATNTSAAAPVTEVQVSPVPIATGLSKSGCTAASGCTFPYSGSFQSPPPVTPPCASSLPNCNPEDGEAQLDTQQASTLAPGSNVLFYLAYNAADCTTASFPSPCASNAPDYGPEIGLIESDPEIMQAIADNAADVLSLSYGGGEPQQGWSGYSGPGGYEGSYSQLEFAALAIEGIAVFVSSGDNGSAECFSATTYLGQVCDSYPAGDPSVTSVGGITANVNVYGQQTAPWLAWGISTFDTGYGATEGSGGGASATGGVGIPAPQWQAAALGATSREQPDVSMIGDPSTGVSTVNNAVAGCGEQICVIGGTSVAAPEMAAMWADVLSACKAHSTGACAGGSGATPWRLGNAAPYLYAIYKATPYTYNSAWMPSLAYNQVFYDIVYGDNQMANPTYTPASPVPGASAGPGYDMVTGVGVPYAGHLIQAITGQPVP
ncbi:MAG: protease pro-enzyme activation domain-containing protein [Candidatus Aquilonibacter sp.]